MTPQEAQMLQDLVSKIQQTSVAPENVQTPAMGYQPIPTYRLLRRDLALCAKPGWQIPARSPVSW
jgi:hypothetical protein